MSGVQYPMIEEGELLELLERVYAKATPDHPLKATIQMNLGPEATEAESDLFHRIIIEWSGQAEHPEQGGCLRFELLSMDATICLFDSGGELVEGHQLEIDDADVACVWVMSNLATAGVSQVSLAIINEVVE